MGCQEGGWGGVGWGHSDFNSKTHAKTIGMYSMFDDFAWVRHVPPLPTIQASQLRALDFPALGPEVYDPMTITYQTPKPA